MKKLILPLMTLAVVSCSTFRDVTRKSKNGSVQQPSSNTESTAKGDSGKPKIKPYGQVITGKAITSAGLFKVHKVEERYFFEVSDFLLNKDILIVNRISKGAAESRTDNTLIGYAGDYIGENVIRFEKGPNQKLFIKRVSYLEISNDSTENGMYRSILNSNLQPIVASFDIKTYAPDSAAVIDLTDYLNGDNDVFFFNPRVKKLIGLAGLQADKSYTQSIASFPLNTEIKTVKTYSCNDQFLTYELNSSMVLLPADAMKPRYNDERVGYFTRGYLNYDAPQKVKADFMIARWRLEPKDVDIEKYKRGELVEPKKPIVFYIDPATPKKWVPYLIKGVNDWQKAFEKAGFKNAIYALEAPANDPSWSIEDARHNVIVYKASYVQNASGPHVSDPRTGEILESHVNWYHNVQQLLHDWYLIQAAPSDPRARKMVFEDTLMGELIRYVCAHEVGHTLGLQHNFISSSTVPTDSLRSRNYVAKYGHTPSIMDYARFNYVAQPEDSIAVKDLIPRIGMYDDWAIEWGYRWLPDLKSKEEEKAYLSQWIIKSIKEEPRLLFVREFFADARNQTEDLGDDAIKASYYGIKNLQYIMSHLKEWTSRANSDYWDYYKMHQAVMNQYARYINLVAVNIGGMRYTPKTIEQEGGIFALPGRERQRAAVTFLQQQLFDTPHWLDNKELFPFVGGGSVVRLYKLQDRYISSLVGGYIWNWLLFNETHNPTGNNYSFDELLTDLEAGIWKELKTHRKVDIFRKSTQNVYITKLIELIRFNGAGDMMNVGGCTIVNNHIEKLYRRIQESLKGYTDESTVVHLKYNADRLKAVIETQKKDLPERERIISVNTTNTFNNSYNRLFTTNDVLLDPRSNYKSCWDAEIFFK